MTRVSFFVAASLFAVLGATASCTKQASASGPAGTKLDLSKPSDQTITQGEANKVAISIDRTGFADPVQVSFTNLPAGVTVDGNSIPSADENKDFSLVAAPTAPLVNKHIVTVTAKGASISTTQTFALTVKAK